MTPRDKSLQFEKLTQSKQDMIAPWHEHHSDFSVSRPVLESAIVLRFPSGPVLESAVVSEPFPGNKTEREIMTQFEKLTQYKQNLIEI